MNKTFASGALTVAPLAIMVVMLVVIYFQAQRRAAKLQGLSPPPKLKPLPRDFWIWVVASAAFIAFMMWRQRH